MWGKNFFLGDMLAEKYFEKRILEVMYVEGKIKSEIYCNNRGKK